MSKTRQSQHRPLTPRTFCLVCPSPSISLHFPFSQSTATLPPIIAFLSCRFKSLMFTYFSISGTNNRPLHTDYFGSLYVSIMYVCPTDITASSLRAFCSSENLFSIANSCVVFYTFKARSDHNRLLCLSVRFMSVCMYTYTSMSNKWN